MKIKSQVGMLPLPVGRGGADAPTGPATAPKPATRSTESHDATESWMADHPVGENFDPATAPTTPTPPVPLEPEPPVEVPETSPDEVPAVAQASDDASAATPTPPVASEVPSATPPTESALDAAAPTLTADAAKQAQQPATAAADPLRLSLEGKYLVADGTEPWSGAQIIQRLRDYVEAEPQVTEAKNFREFFGADFEKAKSAWEPMISALREHPERIGFLEDALEHMPADKFQYLVDSAQNWDTLAAPVAESPAQPAAEAQQPQYAKIDPATQQRLDNFEKYQAEQEAKTQWTSALTEFPLLETREDLRNSLLELFNAMYKRDPATRLEDALRINRPMYQAIAVALGNGQPAPPEPPVVPALNGSPGASPTGTRSRVQPKPKTFPSADDAVDDWLQSHPS